MNVCRACPMLNSQGVCDTALRRPEYIRRCPHDKLRHAIAKAEREKGRPPDG